MPSQRIRVAKNMQPRADRILHLDLTEQDNETLAWSLRYVTGESACGAERFSFIYDLTYQCFAKPSRYIEMSASNFLRLYDVLLTVESRLGCCGRQADAHFVRAKIYKLFEQNDMHLTR